MKRQSKRSPGDRDISILQDMHKRNQLRLAPEFQREAVWSRQAKAYLIDTILNDRPIPLLFFSKKINPSTNRSFYEVVDGQQRLRAIFEFLDDKIRLSSTEETDARWRGRKYSELDEDDLVQLLNYELAIVELKNYSETDIRDVFVRMNKYVARLNAAELRRARESGAFKDLCSRLGQQAFWTEMRILTPVQLSRLRGEELAAEFIILLNEGPQDKKDAIDLYYRKYSEEFPEATELEDRLNAYLQWCRDTLPDFSTSRWRKPVDLYGLLGALDVVTDGGDLLDKLDPTAAGAGLISFEKQLTAAASDKRGDPEATHPSFVTRYLTAASSQTDNIQPRTTRMETLISILESVPLV